jgi:hypothetical protein
VVSVATPEEFKVAVPKIADPFRKVTVPAGKAVPLPFTVAVRDRTFPATTGFGEATRLVVVTCGVISTETAGEVLVRHPAFPAYAAERLYLPTANEDVDKVATPEAFKTPVPNTVLPFRNVTEPAGLVAPVDCTVAVSATAWPMITEFGDAARLVVVD